MEFEWDERKNLMNKWKHGIDFRDAEVVFQSQVLVKIDARKSYGETRYIGYGRLEGRVVVVVYCYRGTKKRIISLRKANASEIKTYREKSHLL